MKRDRLSLFILFVGVVLSLGCNSIELPGPPTFDQSFGPGTDLGGTLAILNTQDRLFPLNMANVAIVQGQTFTSPTPVLNDPTGGVLKVGSWTCTVRTLGLDGNDPSTILSGTSCDSLPSISLSNNTRILSTLADDSTLASFDADTGILIWTPTTVQRGTYAFTLTVSNTVGATATQTFFITVRESYNIDAALDFHVDAQFSEANRALIGSSPTIPRLDGTSLDAVLNGWLEIIVGPEVLLPALAAGAWTGDGTTAPASLAPYALGFNGTSNFIDLGIPFVGELSTGFELWVSPTSLPNTGQVVLSNGGGNANGLVLHHSLSDGNKLEFIVGSKTFNATALALAPVAYWRFGDNGGSGTVAADSSGALACSGAACNILFASTPSTPTAGVGGAVAFDANAAVELDGVNDFFEASTDLGFAINGAAGVSAAAWVNFASLPITNQTSSHLLSIPIEGVNAGFEIHLVDVAGVKNLRVSGRSDLADPIQSATTAFSTANKWVHIAGVLDFPNDQIHIYVDGQLVLNQAVAFSQLTFIRGAPTLNDTIGAASTRVVPTFFHGKIDELMLFNKVLTAANVLSLFNTGVSCQSSTSLEANRFYHVSGIYDNLNRTKLYINGKEECNITDQAVLNDGVRNLGLGGNVTPANFYAGNISDVKLYGVRDGNDALTQAEIRVDFDATANRFRQQPIEAIVSDNLLLHVDAGSADLGLIPHTTGCASTDLSFFDLSSSDTNGTLNNFETCTVFGWQGAGTVASPFRAVFEGDDDFIDFGDVTYLDAITNVSFEVWFKTDILTRNQTVFSKTDGTLAGAGAVMFFTAATNALSVCMSTGVANACVVGPNNSLNDSNWHHAVMTFTGANIEGLKLYIDGSEVSSSPTSTIATASIGANDFRLMLGEESNVAAVDLDGDIATFRIYSTVLTDKQVKQNCLAQEPRFNATAQAICGAP